MSPFVVFPYYLAWHYTRAILDFFDLWKNFLWFVFQFFSIPLLLKTLFAPFKRLKEKGSGDVTDLEGFLEALVVNTIMRLVGFIFRSVVIVFGLLTYTVTLFAGIVAFFLWLLLPALIAFLLVASIIGFFNI